MGRVVLFVDDEAHIRKAVGTFLERRGYDVVLAADGEEALRLAGDRMPEVVITDVMMPRMDGYELTRELRKSPRLGGVPVVMLSARKDESSFLQGYTAGADEYVAKPVQLSVLAAKIEAVVRRQTMVPAERPARARIVTFAHAKGGVGTTTLVVNVGVSSQRSADRSFIVDVSLPTGDAALLLDLDQRRSVASLVDHPVDQIDATVVREAAATRGNLRLLAAPDSPIDADRITGPMVRATILAAAATSDFVYVDTSPAFSEATLAAIDVADAVCVVTSAHVSSVRATHQFLEVLDRLNTPPERISVVVSRTSVGGADDKSIVAALDGKQILVIPYSELMPACGDKGKPVLTEHPDSSVAIALREVAARLRRPADVSLVPSVGRRDFVVA